MSCQVRGINTECVSLPVLTLAAGSVWRHLSTPFIPVVRQLAAHLGSPGASVGLGLVYCEVRCSYRLTARSFVF